MLYSAPALMLMVVDAVVPVTVIGFDTWVLEGSTLLSGTSLKVSGMVLTPVPLSVTVAGEAAELLVITTVPLRLPSLVGVNRTWMVQLVPVVSGALQSL